MPPSAEPNLLDPDRAARASKARDTTSNAGRGGLAIAGAKLYFIGLGLLQQSLMNHLLGAGYGTYRRALSVATIVYNPVITSGVQGVSRSVSSASPDDRAAATRRSVIIQALSAQPLALGVFLFAPTLAGALHADHLTVPLRILAATVSLYGLYAPLVGVLNGERRFITQAALDSLFATLRTLGLVFGAWYFGHHATRIGAVEGSLLGFVAAALLIVLVTLPLAGFGKPGSGGVTLRRQLAFIAPLYAGQFTLNLLMQGDLHLLGRFAADAAVAGGLDARAADPLVGAYGVAQLFCFLPYQMLISVTSVLFPLLASAHREGDREAVASYAQTGMRLALLVAGAFVSVNAGLTSRLLALVFRAEDATLGGTVMLPLGIGLGSFAIFGVLVTVLTSLGHERTSALLTIMALAFIVVACVIVVPGAPFGGALLMRTAIGTACGLGLATLLAAAAVRKVAGAVVPLATLARVGGSVAASVIAARFLAASMPSGKLVTLALWGIVGTLYIGLLAATRELDRADFARISRLIRKRR